jgi:DNA-directed RNA polymerase specialized sigma24 family protein
VTTRPSTHIALAELEDVFTFIYSRVGNRRDAEDLTLQVALKALPYLREGGRAGAIRGRLFMTARLALSEFWSARLDVTQDDELNDPDHWGSPESVAPEDSDEVLQRVLSALSANHRRFMELRFVDGRSLKEVADEMNSSVRAAKVMQLCALRAAAKLGLADRRRSTCNDHKSSNTAFK